MIRLTPTAGVMLGLLVAGLSGCSPVSQPSDPAAGKASLQQALDAWKGGGAGSERMTLSQSPPQDDNRFQPPAWR